MPKKLAISSVLLLANALPAVVQAQIRVGPQVPAPAGIEVPKDGVTIPMQDMGGRPVVEIKINGKGPYRFILDTGAVTTVVSDGRNCSQESRGPKPLRQGSSVESSRA
jgi:Retroviral aspartyl protease